MKTSIMNKFYSLVFKQLLDEHNRINDDSLSVIFAELCEILEVKKAVVYQFDFHKNSYSIIVENQKKSNKYIFLIQEIDPDTMEKYLRNLMSVTVKQDKDKMDVGNMVEVTTVDLPIFLKKTCFGFYQLSWDTKISVDDNFTDSLKELANAFNALLVSKVCTENFSNLQEDYLALRKDSLASLEKKTHNLKTPLNGITSALSILKENSEYTHHNEQFKIIDYCTQQLLHEVNDIIDVGNDKYNLSNQISNVNLEKEIKQIINYYQYLAKSHKTEIKLKYCYKIPSIISVDVNKIRKIIGNLLYGAIKNSVSSVINLSIKTKKIEKPYITLDFIIEYEGPLFVKNEDFMDYYDLQSVTQKRKIDFDYKIVKDFINSLKGRLLIEEVNQQSTYRFTLKFYIPQNGPTFKAREDELLPVISPEKLSISSDDKKVLIVDDNRINRRVLKTLLKRYNVESIEATSGYEAVDLVKKNNFQLIFMDILMPGMNGFETTRQIRELFVDLPIIAVTANNEEKTKEEAIQCGMNGFISKPLDQKSLRNIITEYGLT